MSCSIEAITSEPGVVNIVFDKEGEQVIMQFSSLEAFSFAEQVQAVSVWSENQL